MRRTEARRRGWIGWGIGLLAACLLLPARAKPLYGPREVAELLEIARSEDEPEQRRARAIRQLEYTDVRTHLSALRRLLREERSLDIRLSAACTLVALGDRQAPRDLLLVAAYDGTVTPNCPRGTVLRALGRLGDPAGEMHLEKALREEAPANEPFFYNDACWALQQLGTPGARRILLETLRTGSPGARHAAVTPLGSLAANPTCAERAAIRRALVDAARSDPEERVAEQAAAALLWSVGDGPAFFRLLENDPDPRVRARAARVMDRHFLGPARLQRLRAALARERDPDVRRAIQATLASQGR